jgi:DNA-binding CsgD family transcriptional regulator
VVGAWPLVGRREELERIERVLRDRAASGVVVAGAAGVGKTRFAREALGVAEAAGCFTLWSTATRAAASIPFGAFAHLLPVPDAGPAGRLDLLRRAGGALREQANGRRLVLAIDDAHLLDEASAALAHQLASTATAFILVTLRRGEPALDPIAALWKDGLAEYLELQSLAQPDVKRLIPAALGGDVDGPTLLRLWEATRGNALFLRELVVGGLEQGTLSGTSGVWRWTGTIKPGARLGEIVESRLGRLADTERAALELVALGEPIGIRLIEPLAAPGALEQLQRRGLLVLERSGRRTDARLAHPLYGEVLRASTPALGKMCARLAELLEATGARRREDLLRLASWRLEAGVPGDPELLIAAAWRAQAAFDPALAERLAGAAVAAGGGFAARHALGVALNRQGRFEEAETVLVALESSTDDDEQAALIADGRASNLFWGMGLAPDAERVLLRAEAQVRDRDIRDELTAVRAAQLAFAGRAAQALDAARLILDRDNAGERPFARAGLAAITALALTGGSEQARTLVGRLREPAVRLAEELPFLPSQLLAAYSLVLTLAGYLEEATAEAKQGYEGALADHAHDASALWAMMLARAQLGQGAIRKACSLLQEGAALFADVDSIGFGPLCLAFLAQARAVAGEPSGAQTALIRAEASCRPGIRIFDADLGLARAWTSAAAGEFSAARAQALCVAEETEASGQLAYAALALHDVARLGDPTTVTDRLRALANTLDGRLAPTYASHAAALAAGDGIALDDTAARFAQTGARLLAAEAFAEAAAAHREHGRTASATRSATRASMLAEQCDGAHTPALAQAENVATLTRRERELASLASSGLSNKAIAERLVLSVRTVEHHLQHVYQKIGVSDRTQLAPLLGPTSPPADPEATPRVRPNQPPPKSGFAP